MEHLANPVSAENSGILGRQGLFRSLSRFLALLVLATAALSLAACGGGSGDGNNDADGVNDAGDDNNDDNVDQQQTLFVITSTPELDGTTRGNGVSQEGRADVETAVGDGPFVVGEGSNRFQAYYSFDLSEIPANSTVTSATLSLFSRGTFGDPEAMMVQIIVDHVNFGTLFPQAPLGGTTLTFDIVRILDLNTQGRKDVDVTAQVQEDVDSIRTRSQYRLRGAITSNNDDVADVVLLTDGEDTGGAGELPLLIVEIAP